MPCKVKSNKNNNNQLIKWPLSDVFSSGLLIFPATLSFCQTEWVTYFRASFQKQWVCFRRYCTVRVMKNLTILCRVRPKQNYSIQLWRIRLDGLLLVIFYSECFTPKTAESLVWSVAVCTSCWYRPYGQCGVCCRLYYHCCWYRPYGQCGVCCRLYYRVAGIVHRISMWLL